MSAHGTNASLSDNLNQSKAEAGLHCHVRRVTLRGLDNKCRFRKESKLSREQKKAFLGNWKISFKYLIIVMSGIIFSSFHKLQHRILSYLIICCSVFSSGFLSASVKSIYQSESQQIYFNNIAAEKYTIHPVINAIEQDYQGYIWFGTQSGLIFVLLVAIMQRAFY
jgi:hypothetical protein